MRALAAAAKEQLPVQPLDHPCDIPVWLTKPHIELSFSSRNSHISYREPPYQYDNMRTNMRDTYRQA